MNSSSDSLAHLRLQNVSVSERKISLAAGLGLTIWGMASRGNWGRLLLATGGYLIYRGATGICPLTQAAGWRTRQQLRPDLDRRFGDSSRDMVEEASWESFPASDPPAW